MITIISLQLLVNLIAMVIAITLYRLSLKDKNLDTTPGIRVFLQLVVGYTLMNTVISILIILW